MVKDYKWGDGRKTEMIERGNNSLICVCVYFLGYGKLVQVFYADYPVRYAMLNLFIGGGVCACVCIRVCVLFFKG